MKKAIQDALTVIAFAECNTLMSINGKNNEQSHLEIDAEDFTVEINQNQ